MNQELKKGLKITRYFTEKGKDVFDSFEFIKRESTLKNPDGSTVFEMKDLEVPNSWSQLATDILAQKYIRKAGVPQKDGSLGSEKSIKQVAHRIVGCWRDWGEKHDYFSTEEDAQAFYDECVHMIITQTFAPNSPQWFNTGLAYAYGITGKPQGHYYVDPKTEELKLSEDAYTRPQPHACFIQSVSDNLVNEGGIFDLALREARVFKYGSGSGSNFSSLRGKGERLSGGGSSSGLMSFLKIFDVVAGAIKSGGTTRRAAKMVCLDVDHPEIEDFVMWKYKEEQKVVDLVAGSKVARKQLGEILEVAQTTNTDWKNNKELRNAMKNAMKLGISVNYIFRILALVDQGLAENDFDVFNTHFESEAYSTISGQNSNNSIRLSNDFLEAVKNKTKWNLINRTDGKVYKEIEAVDLWNKICLAAWHSADPGVQFDTTINEWHTCPASGRINASNPCSEYMFLDNTACNLASINLVKFYDAEKDFFDVKGFRHATRLATIVLEISVLMAQFVGPEMAELSYKFRTLGLGYANIGSLLMRKGLAYDDDKARTIAGAITAILTGQAYLTSAEMAGVLGAFNGFEENKEHMLRVIKNHRRAVYDVSKEDYEGLTIFPMAINQELCPDYLLKEAKESWDQALELGEINGYRNAQVTLLAPTGTIGLVMDCDTTGVEPDFAMVKFKKLIGGGYFKIVNQAVPVALKKLGYSEEEINDIVDYAVGHGSLNGCKVINSKILLEKGLSKEVIEKIEEGMKDAFDISFVFNKYTIGEKEFGKLGLKEDSEQSVLEQLGFSKEDINRANEFVCGTMTVEGAPHLKDEHLPIFDCANKCGKKGKRFISYLGHIKMMAAVQPFLSGAISKTVNMDNSALVKDIETAYMTSWKYMVKANALYRDGSKLSQPLNTVVEDFDISMDEDEDANSPEIVHQRIMNRIKPLPPRRKGFIQEASIAGHPISLTTGEYDDGALGELKIEMYKDGSPYKSLMNAFAKAITLGLQYGVPVEDMVEEFTFQGFDPSGMVIGDKAIKQASSPIDYIFRVLGIEYADRKDLAHIKDFETKRDAKKETKKDTSDVLETDSKKEKSNYGELSEEQKAIKEAKSKGYTGEACPSCGSMRLKRNGTCMLCEDCGSTTGCS